MAERERKGNKGTVGPRERLVVRRMMKLAHELAEEERGNEGPEPWPRFTFPDGTRIIHHPEGGVLFD